MSEAATAESVDAANAAEVARINARFDSIVAEIIGDRMLSEEGRREKLARAYVAADDAVLVVRNRAKKKAAAEIAKLEKKLIGPGPASMALTGAEKIARDASFRDALGRANTAAQTPLESMGALVTIGGVQQNVTAPTAALVSMLDQAELVGDTLQAKAILTVAYQARNADVVNAFLGYHADLDTDLNRLWSLTGGTGENLGAELMREMRLGGPPIPEPLRALGPIALRQLAGKTTEWVRMNSGGMR